MVTSAADGPVPFLLRTRSVVLLTLLAMLVIAGAVALHQHSRGRWVLATEHRVLPPAAMRADADKAYTIELRQPWMSRRAKTYPARLLEDGRDLGPVIADRGKLRAEGGGRFVLWEGELSFSSSDGSDPRRNGRRYELVWPMPLTALATNGIKTLAVLLGLIAACAVTSWWRRNPQTWFPRRLGPFVWRALENLGSQGARGHWRAYFLVGLVAIAVRLIALALVHANPADHNSGLLVMGVPFSDAQGWDLLGESVMRGDGLASGWSARRPFLAFVLGEAPCQSPGGRAQVAPKATFKTTPVVDPAHVHLRSPPP